MEAGHSATKNQKSISIPNDTSRPVKEHPFFKPIGKGVRVNSQAKQIILNVLFHIRVIRPKESMNSVVELTSKFTGVSRRTIYRLRSEKEQYERIRSLANSMNEEIEVQPLTEANESGTNDTPSNENPEGEIIMFNSNGTEFVAQSVSANLPQSAITPGTNRLKNASTSKSHVKIRDPPSPRAERKKFTRPTQKRLARFDPMTVSRLKIKVNECLQWKDRPLPTVNQIMEIVNEDPSLPNFKIRTFGRIMCDLGFQKPRSKRKSVKIKTPSNLLNSFYSGPCRDNSGPVTNHLVQAPNNMGNYVSSTTTTPFQTLRKPSMEVPLNDFSIPGHSSARSCFYASTNTTSG